MGGCVSSKGDINDRMPNLFHVWNVDELGNILIPGQIEVADTELVLYQKGKEPIRWPMRCLRRYGFDAELFSFESGRRCATGTGIYAFKCRRAEALFNLLQEQIQNSGQDDASGNNPGGGGISSHSGVGNGIVVAAAAAANGSILRSGSMSIGDSGGNYLEPIVRNRTRSNASRDGFTRMATQSLPSNLAFTENNNNNSGPPVMANGTSSSPHYVNEDIVPAAKGRSGSCRDGRTGSMSLRSPRTPPATLPLLHEYANTAALGEEPEAAAIDLVTRTGLEECQDGCQKEQQEPADGAAQQPQQPQQLQTTTTTHGKMLYSILDFPKGVLGAVKGSNGCRQVMMMRGHSLDDNTNYARLDDLLKQEHTAQQQQHLYMNVVPDSAQKKDSGGGAVKERAISRQKSVESSGAGHHHHHHHSHSISYHPTSGAPVLSAVSRQVNYAVLDLNHRGSSSSGGSGSTAGGNNGGGGGGGNGTETAPTSPTSLATPPPTDASSLLSSGAAVCRSSLEGYATIDFDRTVALSNTAQPCLDDGDSVRKTRHNGTISDLRLSKHGSVVSE